MARGQKRKAETDLGADEGAAIAELLKAKRTNASTKRTYSSKNGIMRDWLLAKFPGVVRDDGSLVLPLPKDAVIGFFGHLSEPAHYCDVHDTHADEAPNHPLSVSTVTGYKSALVDLYRGQSLQFDSALDDELKTTLEGYEKTINDLKKRGLMGINEGKMHLKSSGYDLLARKLMVQRPPNKSESWSTTVFALSFFVLMWSLMSHSDSVDKIMLEHMDWAEDSLIIEEQGHRGDQTGADKYGKHVYVNPYEPSKCPVLALVVLLFTYPERLNGRHQLFVGKDNKGRFWTGDAEGFGKSQRG